MITSLLYRSTGSTAAQSRLSYRPSPLPSLCGSLEEDEPEPDEIVKKDVYHIMHMYGDACTSKKHDVFRFFMHELSEVGAPHSKSAPKLYTN